MNLEVRTLVAMIRIYCRAHHGTAKGLCAECAGLSDYACQRIEKCPFGHSKPVCSKCAVHCYEAVMREQIRGVMRYAGPRMAGRHRR